MIASVIEGRNNNGVILPAAPPMRLSVNFTNACASFWNVVFNCAVSVNESVVAPPGVSWSEADEEETSEPLFEGYKYVCTATEMLVQEG
jgi:hypothetical protein